MPRLLRRILHGDVQSISLGAPPGQFQTGVASRSPRLAYLRRPEPWLVLGAGLLVAVALWLLSGPLTSALNRGEDMRVWIEQFGIWAPLAYIGLFVIQIVIAPFPGQLMAVMSGYVFGFLWGALYSLVGLSLGALIAMGLARLFGRPLLERFFAPAQLGTWERKLRMRSFATWWLLFLFPIPDLIYYVAGLTAVPLGRLLLAAITGRGLGLIFATIIGNTTALLPPEWALVKWAILAIFGLTVYIYQRPIRYAVLVSFRRLQIWGRQGRRTVAGWMRSSDDSTHRS